MEKGARVRIVRGKGKDVAGTIFWKGPNKWGSGDRFGVQGDDGETYWVASDNVEADDNAAPVPEEPNLEKGMRVRWKRGQDTGTGAVFWLGPSKTGSGTRVGVRDDETEDAVWLAGHLVTVLEEGEAPPPQRRQAAPVASVPVETDGPPTPPAESYDSVSMDEAAPFAPPPTDADIPDVQDYDDAPSDW
jgi:hypothetical protein